MKNFFSIIFLLLVFGWVQAQQKYSVNGYLKDSKTGEDLIGVTVYVPELKAGTTTNVYGFYSLSLPEGSYTLIYSYIGYESQEQKVNLI